MHLYNSVFKLCLTQPILYLITEHFSCLGQIGKDHQDHLDLLCHQGLLFANPTLAQPNCSIAVYFVINRIVVIADTTIATIATVATVVTSH